MHSNIKAIFFDIGGTLRISQKERNLEKIKELVTFLGEKIPVGEFITRVQEGEKAYHLWSKPTYLELSEAELWSRFLLPDYPKQFIRENAVKINQLWRESHEKQLLPDLVETMLALHERGYKLGLISNTTSSVEAYQILEDTGLTSLFSCVILSCVFGRRKPHPSLFLEAARLAGVLPEECAYVGDRPTRDLLGARQSNYGQAVLINTGCSDCDETDLEEFEPEKDKHLLLKPDHSIRRLSELLDIYPVIKKTGRASREGLPLQMYDAALSTMWGVDQDFPFNETFEQARLAGFGRFELNHKVIPSLFEQWDKDRNYIATVHDPCPAVYTVNDIKINDYQVSSLDESSRIKGVDIIKRTIDLAYHLGSRSVVIHPGMIMGDRTRDRHLREMYKKGLKNTLEYEEVKKDMITHRAELSVPHMEQVVKSIQEVIEFSRSTGLSIGLENRYRYYDIPIPGEMEKLLSLCDENWFGFQYDSGHAQTLSALGLCDHEDWLRWFGHRIIGTHLHDVKGILDHQQPGTGDVDFRLISRYLPATACRTLEVEPKLIIDQLKQGMEFLAETGCVDRI